MARFDFDEITAIEPRAPGLGHVLDNHVTRESRVYVGVDDAHLAPALLPHRSRRDGVRGRDSAVLILRDGNLLGGGAHFWLAGSYKVGAGTWIGPHAVITGPTCSNG